MFLGTYFLQATRILANLIVMGSGIMARAFVQAYRQALASMIRLLRYNLDLLFPFVCSATGVGKFRPDYQECGS